MGGYVVRMLTEDTWPAFAELVEANNGVWGGCWCMGFHVNLKGRTPQDNRDSKQARVREGTTHNARSFLHTGPMAAFERHGFARTRPISPHRWVVTRTV